MLQKVQSRSLGCKQRVHRALKFTEQTACFNMIAISNQPVLFNGRVNLFKYHSGWRNAGEPTRCLGGDARHSLLPLCNSGDAGKIISYSILVQCHLNQSVGIS